MPRTICAVYGEGTEAERTEKQFARFKFGNFNLENQERLPAQMIRLKH